MIISCQYGMTFISIWLLPDDHIYYSQPDFHIYNGIPE